MTDLTPKADLTIQHDGDALRLAKAGFGSA